MSAFVYYQRAGGINHDKKVDLLIHRYLRAANNLIPLNQACRIIVF